MCVCVCWNFPLMIHKYHAFAMRLLLLQNLQLVRRSRCQKSSNESNLVGSNFKITRAEKFAGRKLH